MPRINFVSFTFLFAFGLGSFVGIAMALLAVALARPADETTVIEPEQVAVVATPTPTRTPTPVPTATQTPVPPPRTRSTQQVRIGPDDGYAVLGTLASGSEVDLQGRDDSGDWLAIEFPPGSSARGWIPTDAVDAVTLVQVFRLDVLQATLVETSPRFPFVASTPSLLEGNDGIPAEGEGTATQTPSSGTPASGTPTPAALAFGPTDLALGSVSVTSDGRVAIVVENQGPGDVPNLSVGVTADGFPFELLSTGIVRAGEGATLRTSEIQLTESTNIVVTIDPDGALSDVARANNTRSVTLGP